MKCLGKNKYKLIIISFVLIILVFSYATKDKIKTVFLSANENMTQNGISNHDAQVREKYNFNYDWKFAYGEGLFDSGSDYKHYCLINDHNNCIDALTSPGSEYEIVSSLSVITDSDAVYSNEFNATNNDSFTTVSLPHTYNDIDTFDNYTESGQNGDRSMYTGSAWYKKEFNIDSSLIGNKKFYIEFEGARQALTLYINGNKLDGSLPEDLDLDGTYQNGFIPVGYDLTPFIVAGNNYITVKSDNSYLYKIINSVNGQTNSIIPWNDSHWHPTYGGLYRNSNFYIMDNLHLTLPLYSFIEGEGTYIYSSDISTISGNTSAKINIDAQVQNSGSNTQIFQVRSKIVDANDNIVSTITSENKTLAGNSKDIYHLETTLQNVKLWSTDYPYLYKVLTEIVQADNVIDNNSDDIGIRTFRFTSDSGFYLNENYEELNGWGQKSTMEWAGLGSAYPDWMTDYIIKLMKDANANYIRWGHTSGSPAQIESCEKYGLLVTQPGVDGEGVSYDANSLLLRIEAMRDMIIYYRNSPAIIMWELGNQASVNVSTLSTNYISAISGLNSQKTSASLYELLHDVVTKYDYGNRSDTIVNAGTYDTSSDSNDRLLTIRRGSSAVANYVENEETTLGGIQIDGKTYVEGEYNRLESPRRIWDKYTNNFSTTNSYYKTSEDYSLSQIKDMGMVTGQPGIVASTNGVGGANWIFSDSESHGRVNSEVTRTSGEVDAVMLPKDAYYVDQVIFSKTPLVHIIGHWNYSSGTTKSVYVAARHVNSLDLYVNDTKYTGTLSNSYLWTFNNVIYEAGTIRVEGKNANGNIVATDSITTTGSPDHINLSYYVGNEGLKANGSDILLIDAEVVDVNGNRVVTYDGITSNDITTFTVNDSNNASIWRGGYNSSLENTTNNKSLYLEAGINRVAIKTTLIPGTITVSASTASGLTSNTISVNSSAVDNTNGFASLTNTSTYSLQSLTDPGYGDGSKLGISNKSNVSNSTLIKNLSYTGSLVENPIKDAFSVNKKMYSDLDITFTSIPYALSNSEYLLFPNADKTTLAVDLITFTAKKDITVMILRDPNIVKPSWLGNFTKNPEIVIGGNGVKYQIYTKRLTKNSSLTIGGNADNFDSGNAGYNQIVLFKSTESLNNNEFFKEDFTDFDMDSLNNSWHPHIVTNTNIEIDNELNGSTLHFTDSVTDDLAYVQKSFADVSHKFKLKFKVYVKNYSSTHGNNSWLRFWLTDGLISSEGDKSHIATEAYINNEGSSLEFVARSVNNQSSLTTLSAAKRGITYDSWHNYEIIVDMEEQTYTLVADDIVGSTTYPIYAAGLSKVNNLVIGSSKSLDSDFYVDDIEIVEIPDNIITNVAVDGINVTSFATLSYDYNIPELSENSVITFDTTEIYASHTTTYNTETQALTLVLRDIYNNEFTYYFHNISPQTLLEDYTLSVPPNTSVIEEPFDNVDAIHFIDNSTTQMAYITKSIGDQTDEFILSFDAYITNTKDNKYLRVFLSNGIGGNYKNNVGVASYLYRNGNVIGVQTELAKGTTSIDETGTINDWHHYKYVINPQTSSYEIYRDNISLGTTAFYSTQSTINYVLFSTGIATLSDYNIKNIKIEKEYVDPITDIQINENSIGSFVPETYIYDYYSSENLDANTVLSVVGTEEYKSFTITKNIVEQYATIVVTNMDNIKFTYRINFFLTSQAHITKEQLQDLINEINLLNQNNYSSASWNELMYYVNIGNGLLLLENPIQENINNNYYDIINYRNNLIIMKEYTDYQTSLFQNVFYSADLENKFLINDVMQNNAKIYNDQNSIFTSVPNVLQNAEFFVINNENVKTAGEIMVQTNLTIDRPLSLMILKDRNSGVLTDNTFIFTGDIVTSDSGVVYKVYKKDYNEGDIIEIDFRKLVCNNVTGYNNIIAFKDRDSVTNNWFYKENLNLLNDAMFKKTWSYVNGNPDYNDIRIEQKNGENALYVLSDSNSDSATQTAAYISKRFANINSKLKLSFDVYAPVQNNANTLNQYSRVFLMKDNVPNINTVTDAESKSSTLVEAYVDTLVDTKNYKPWIAYRSKTKKSNAKASLRALTTETWEHVTMYVDIANKSWQLELNEEGKSASFDFLHEFDYTNILYFANRKTGPTSVWYKNIEIEPIELNYLTNISLNDINVVRYSSNTLNYLVPLSSLDIIAVNPTSGTEESVVNITNESNYKNISATVGDTIKLNHQIYYELDVDKTLLTKYIESFYTLDETLYTTESWNDLEISLNNSITILQSIDSDQTIINNAANDLKNKIDSLQLINTISLFYTGGLSYGSEYNNHEAIIDITNDSAITMDAQMHIDFGIDTLSTYTHHRQLISSVNIPTGTTLTMIDLNEANPIYYYYVVETAINEINLSDFIKMGTTTEHYINTNYYNNETFYIDEHFQFVIDYGNSQSKLVDGTYTIKLIDTIGSNNIANMNELTYNIYTPQNTAIISSNLNSTNYYANDSILIGEVVNYPNIITNDVTIINTNRWNKQYAMRFSIYKDDVKLNLPEGMSIIINDLEYYPTYDNLTIYLGNIIERINNTLVLSFGEYNSLPSGNYTLKSELIESFNGMNLGNVIAIKNNTFRINETLKKSFKIILDENSKNIISEGKSQNITYSFITLNYTNYDIIVSLEKLSNNNYELINLNDYVTNIMDTYEVNKYNLGNSINYTFNFNDNLPKGTYRLKYEIKENDTLSSERYKYIIVK